jgi:hypothetical protein
LYDREFFAVVSNYHLISTMNISRMSTKEWYRVLMEDQLLMSQPTADSPAKLLPIRAEILSSEQDWSKIWRLVRVQGLGVI